MSLLRSAPYALRRLSVAHPGLPSRGVREAQPRPRATGRLALRPFVGAVAVAAVVGALAACSSGPELTVRDAWIRLTDPSRPLGGFMTIANSGPTDDALVGAESPAFAMIELHETVAAGSAAPSMPSDHGMGGPGSSGDMAMTMRPVEAIPIPARGEQVLRPGGYHLMLMSPKQTLAAGDVVELTLRFQSGRSVSVEVPVRAP